MQKACLPGCASTSAALNTVCSQPHWEGSITLLMGVGRPEPSQAQKQHRGSLGVLLLAVGPAACVLENTGRSTDHTAGHLPGHGYCDRWLCMTGHCRSAKAGTETEAASEDGWQQSRGGLIGGTGSTC